MKGLTLLFLLLFLEGAKKKDKCITVYNPKTITELVTFKCVSAPIRCFVLDEVVVCVANKKEEVIHVGEMWIANNSVRRNY